MSELKSLLERAEKNLEEREKRIGALEKSLHNANN